jgi:hypothetical protein
VQIRSFCADGAAGAASVAAPAAPFARAACPGWQASLLYCLQAAVFSLTDIDLVAVSGLGDQPPGPGEPGLHHLGINITRIRPVDHHLSHAYSA